MSIAGFGSEQRLQVWVSSGYYSDHRIGLGGNPSNAVSMTRIVRSRLPGTSWPRTWPTRVINLPAPSVTTRPDGGVLHIVTRYDGSEANPIAMTGVDRVLSNGASGPHATYDLTVCIGWSRAMAPGTYASASTWPTGRVVVGQAIELLSR